MGGKIPDAPEQGAVLLFHRLKRCKPCGSAFVGEAVSDDYCYRWAMTPEYMDECIFAFAESLIDRERALGVSPSIALRLKAFVDNALAQDGIISLPSPRKLSGPARGSWGDPHD